MSQENNIPRIDPENRMGLDFHVGRTLGRKKEDGTPEFEGLTPEARRASIISPDTAFREGDVMRKALLSALDRIEGVRTREQQEFLDRLMGQCQQVASVWTEKFPLKNALLKEELMAGAERFLQSLPTETLQGFLELCPDSTRLVIMPKGIAAPQLLQAIDRNKTMPGQRNSEIWSQELWNNVKLDSWKVGIADCREDIPFDPSIYWVNPEAPERQRQVRTNEQMVAEYKRRFEEKGLTIMPQHGAVPTHATQLAQGKVVDEQFWTAFERPVNASLLPCAFWDNFRVDLGDANPRGSYGDLRCRAWAEGDIA